jgi:hypothetical protein
MSLPKGGAGQLGWRNSRRGASGGQSDNLLLQIDNKLRFSGVNIGLAGVKC